MTIEELAKELYDNTGAWKKESTRVAEYLLENFTITRIDPLKQCYLDEGQCGCQIPGTCVFDDDEYGICDCDIAAALALDGKTRDDCPHWGKK